MADTSYGWAGWIARVNLTSGAITEESDVEMQKDYIGGMGFANKIMYDEVPAGVDWMDEENKAVLDVGYPVHLYRGPPGCRLPLLRSAGRHAQVFRPRRPDHRGQG